MTESHESHEVPPSRSQSRPTPLSIGVGHGTRYRNKTAGAAPIQPVGIPTRCAGCGAPLHPHNLTRLCSECKLIARNRRLTGQPADTADPVTPDQAIANAAAFLGARTIHEGAHLA